MKRPLKKSSPSRPMKPARRKPIVISFQSICQSPRKLWATSDQASADVRRWRQDICSPAAWCWWPVSASCAWRRAASSSVRRDEPPQQHRHQHDHHDAADVLGEGELPAEQDPEDEPELPDEVGRGELEGERGRRRGALLEEGLGDRDRGVGAGGGGGTEPGRPGDRPGARCPTGSPRSARAGPRPGRWPRSQSRARAPTTPRRPSGRIVRTLPRPCSRRRPLHLRRVD